MSRQFLTRFSCFVAWVCISQTGFAQQSVVVDATDATQDKHFVQYGEMHKVIGQQQHEGRVSVKELVHQPHLFAVGAMEGLLGEITFIDSKPIITKVNEHGQPLSVTKELGDLEATMLIGDHVGSWIEIAIPKPLTDQELDEFVEGELKRLDHEFKRPAMFRVVGNFEEVDLHVLNGACPVHARIRKIEIPESKRPCENTLKNVGGELVGVFALDAVGKLTHPATKTHKHFVYFSKELGANLTGHAESVRVAAVATLLLPKP